MQTPFSLDDPDTYLRWRDQKLNHAITVSADLIVVIKQPSLLTTSEKDALHERIRNSNMAIYATQSNVDEAELQQFASQFGLRSLDANWLADEQGITHITVSASGDQRQAYIPYTDRAIKWHTDGYYNPPERQIRSMVLHCVQSAGSGGLNRVLDHEIVYLLLRDKNPDYIRALSTADAMTIPARTDENGDARPAQTGPVFSVDNHGNLHMRYTARTRSIEWKADAITMAAVDAMETLLASDMPHIHQIKLENGMGLLCNNVLHDRSAFTNDMQQPRLLYRARYLDRISTTGDP